MTTNTPHAIPIYPALSTVDVDGAAYLALAHDDLAGCIQWLSLALKGRPDLEEALGLELDTLRSVQAALEQEMEATP